MPSPLPLEAGEGRSPEWTRALAAVVRAEGEIDDFARRTRGKARSFDEQCALDEAFGDRVVLHNRAVERLIRTRAPDLTALAVKVAVAVDEKAWELPDGEACMAALKADATRLVGQSGTLTQMEEGAYNRGEAGR